MLSGTRQVDDIALANAAVLTALLERLVDKKLLSRKDARSVLADAVANLDGQKDKLRVRNAINLIGDYLAPRFIG